MAHALNEAAFKKPHWELVAKGYAWKELDIYFSARGGMVERNGGIERPNRTSLYVGSCYHRFADLNAPRDTQVSGNWWLDPEQLDKIMYACPSRGLNLSQMARAFLAVPWEWNHADAIVTACIMQPLDAYEGKGRPVIMGKNYTGTLPVDDGNYPGNPDCLQLFIPDLRSVWRQALGQISVRPVREFARGYRDIIRV